MRTTLNLDEDVLDKARALSGSLNVPFRQVVNEALRTGLSAVEQPAKKKLYRTKPHRMGLKAGRNLDDIQGLISEMEGEGTP